MIPSRMGSKRLPGKALMDIHGKPMIVRVYEACARTGLPVMVKTPDEEIFEAIADAGGVVCWCAEPNCHNGTDAIGSLLGCEGDIVEAWSAPAEDVLDDYVRTIINVQGDLPLITPDIILDIAEKCEESSTGVSMKAGRVTCQITRDEVVGYTREEGNPSHVGVYAYSREALLRYRAIPRPRQEIEMDLEGWRAIGKMKVNYAWVDSPRAVDTKEDLEYVRENWN